ncbi:MAG: hemolysin family protein [Candidatus Obscuribacterales bacterium]|jgi:CBS domain containing-hemolysin-like protein
MILSTALIWLGLLLVFVVLNGLFVAAEYSLIRLRGSQVEEMIQRKVMGASTIKNLLDNMDRSVAGAQLGITIGGLAVGGVGQEPIRALLQIAADSLVGYLPFLANVHVPAFVGIALSFLILTILHVIIGEQLPKLLALRSPQRIALTLGVPFALFCRFTAPLLWLVNGITSLILRIPGMPKKVEHSGSAPSSDELQIIIEDSARAGSLGKGESNLLRRALELRGLTVFDIMVPLSLIDGLPEEMSLADALDVISQTRHSRLPIFSNGRKAVVGILNSRELLDILKKKLRVEMRGVKPNPGSTAALTGNEAIGKLSAFVRKPYFVNEDVPAAELLHQLQTKKLQLAICTDASGAVVGLITQEDLLEQLVGEIHDEWDKAIEGVEILDGGRFRIDSEFTLFEFRKVFDQRIVSEADATTVVGVVQAELGRPAQIGDSVTLSSYLFTVVVLTAGGAIARLEVKPLLDGSGADLQSSGHLEA